MCPSDPDPMSEVYSLLPARPAGDCIAMRGLSIALRERAHNLDIAGGKIATATPKDMWECPQAEAFYERMEDLQHLAHKSLPDQLGKLAAELERECVRVADAQSDWDRSMRHLQDVARDAVRRGDDPADAVRRQLPYLLF